MTRPKRPPPKTGPGADAGSQEGTPDAPAGFGRGPALTRAELIELATRPINLGRPRPERAARQTGAQLLDDLTAWLAAHGEQVPTWLAEMQARERAIAPARRRAVGAGRPSKRTQYDTWADRRRDIHRRLVKLPGLGRAAGWQERAEYVETLSAVIADATIPVRREAAEVVQRMVRQGWPAPSQRTVSRHLALLRK